MRLISTTCASRRVSQAIIVLFSLCLSLFSLEVPPAKIDFEKLESMPGVALTHAEDASFFTSPDEKLYFLGDFQTPFVYDGNSFSLCFAFYVRDNVDESEIRLYVESPCDLSDKVIGIFFDNGRRMILDVVEKNYLTLNYERRELYYAKVEFSSFWKYFRGDFKIDAWGCCNKCDSRQLSKIKRPFASEQYKSLCQGEKYLWDALENQAEIQDTVQQILEDEANEKIQRDEKARQRAEAKRQKKLADEERERMRWQNGEITREEFLQLFSVLQKKYSDFDIIQNDEIDPEFSYSFNCLANYTKREEEIGALDEEGVYSSSFVKSDVGIIELNILEMAGNLDSYKLAKQRAEEAVAANPGKEVIVVNPDIFLTAAEKNWDTAIAAYVRETSPKPVKATKLGTTRESSTRCPNCHGFGFYTEKELGDFGYVNVNVTCPVCGGSGDIR